MHINREGEGVADYDQKESKDIFEQSGEDPVEHDSKVAPLKGISSKKKDQLEICQTNSDGRESSGNFRCVCVYFLLTNCDKGANDRHPLNIVFHFLKIVKSYCIGLKQFLNCKNSSQYSQQNLDYSDPFFINFSYHPNKLVCQGL